MKKFILLFLCFGFVNLFAQSPLEKISPRLQLKMQAQSSTGTYLVWVYFNDKGNNLESYFANPQSVVSEKSLKRRAKVLDKNELIKFTDLPVNQNYIDQLTELGFKVKHKSRWFNSVSGYASESLINQIAQKSCVKLLDVVGTFAKAKDDLEFKQSENTGDLLLQPNGTNSLNYGPSFTQVNQIDVPAVHDSGYSGYGITICVLDAGFNNLAHETFDNMDIIAAYDFVNNDPNVGDEGDMGTGSHGTATLSIIGGYTPGQLIGPAYGASYILAKTENTDSETPIEEDNWIAGLEWADSIGVDVTSTSLSYLDYDSPYTSYTWQDMDGNTALITIAADLAAGKGIVVVNAASNNGLNTSHNTLGAPADGDSVFTIGAVTSSGTRSSFSSVGPTVDGRTKPDLMAMGSNVYHAGSYGNSYYGGDGTSFSCPLVAGVCALLLEANPNLTPMEVLGNLRITGDHNLNPNNEYGWGIINALNALNLGIVPVELTTFSGAYLNGKVNLTWITATETNNFGFEVERRQESSGFKTIGFVNGNGTTTNKLTYSFTDDDLFAGKYYYRLKQIDFDGSFKYSDEILVTLTGLTDFRLFQNYPNPFNPTTKIKFYIPNQEHVRINLYDVLGNKIKTILDDQVSTGAHEVLIDGSNLASGMYLVKMQYQDKQQTVKISLIK